MYRGGRCTDHHRRELHRDGKCRYPQHSRDRYGIAREHHHARCFFAISKVLPRDEAIEAIRQSIRDTYGKKGEEVVQKNLCAVEETLAHLFEVSVPEKATSQVQMPAPFSPEAPQYECGVLGAIYAGHGDDLPVSAFSCDGTFPTATAKWEKRNLAPEIPVKIIAVAGVDRAEHLALILRRL